MKLKLKTPISYYGGKQNLAAKILSLIPPHVLYCEPFAGGAAVFFAKEPSAVEVLNDTNEQLINFYKVVQQDFINLETEIRISLHSRDLYNKAAVIYNYPNMFSEVKRAWAVWILSSQSFAAKLNSTWGFNVTTNTLAKKVSKQRERFTEEMAIRLQNVQLECADALYVISSRDHESSFFYLDPPYFNATCGHYNGYAEHDFENLLKLISQIKGKFLLSTYPSNVLKKYAMEFGWFQFEETMDVVVNRKSGQSKKKVEIMTTNYSEVGSKTLFHV